MTPPDAACPNPGIRPGGYLVSWRVPSQDSHPVGGSLAFTVGTVVEPGPLPVAPPDTPNGLVGTAFWLFRSLGYLVLVLVVVLVLVGGCPLFLLVCWPDGLTDARARHLAGGGTVRTSDIDAETVSTTVTLV